MSDDLCKQLRYDLQGDEELEFLRGQGHDDNYILKTLLPLRKKGRRRWRNRISAKESYIRNRVTKKEKSRLQSAAHRAKVNESAPEVKEFHSMKKKAQQREWRARNRQRLAEKERIRRSKMRPVI
ncbi:hypothetical protein VNI00_019458 [Paramarasmius palmivorus]|uniref:Uncharacterized protein n=1 Tax=Paramarasmius palmivorus TaxID=297713 RepID=A0AAW0AKD6_9AGAR